MLQHQSTLQVMNLFERYWKEKQNYQRKFYPNYMLHPLAHLSACSRSKRSSIFEVHFWIFLKCSVTSLLCLFPSNLADKSSINPSPMSMGAAIFFFIPHWIKIARTCSVTIATVIQYLAHRVSIKKVCRSSDVASITTEVVFRNKCLWNMIHLRIGAKKYFEQTYILYFLIKKSHWSQTLG